MTDLEIRDAAVRVYREYREKGWTERAAAQAAWEEIRRLVPRLRAPYWDEALGRNGGRSRSYRSPLGE